jgi:hypothetical protein
MRSFVALMTCIGCIAWIHSCDKRLLGVQLENNNTANQPAPLPVVIVVPAVAAPVDGIPVVSANNSLAPGFGGKKTARPGKQAISSLSATPLRFNLALVRGPYAMYTSTVR